MPRAGERLPRVIPSGEAWVVRMKPRIVLAALMAATLFAPTAIAATSDALAPSLHCIPNPDFSPVSNIICCVVNRDLSDPECRPH